MKKEHVKPVLLSAAQVAALKAIQEQETPEIRVWYRTINP